MKTLNISASDKELSKFGIKKDKITFSEFVEIVSKELTREALDKCTEIANKLGLSKLSMEEITKEVKAARKDAKSNN